MKIDIVESKEEVDKLNQELVETQAETVKAIAHNEEFKKHNEIKSEELEKKEQQINELNIKIAELEKELENKGKELKDKEDGKGLEVAQKQKYKEKIDSLGMDIFWLKREKRDIEEFKDNLFKRILLIIYIISAIPTLLSDRFRGNFKSIVTVAYNKVWNFLSMPNWCKYAVVSLIVLAIVFILYGLYKIARKQYYKVSDQNQGIVSIYIYSVFILVNNIILVINFTDIPKINTFLLMVIVKVLTIPILICNNKKLPRKLKN